jgi:hypothetical protein
MKNLLQFIPSGMSLALGVGLGTATQNLAVGIATAIVFTIASRFKFNKGNCYF